MKGAGASAQLRLQNIRGASASDFKISEVGHVFVPGGCFNRDKSSPNGPGWWLQPGPIPFVPVRATNRDKMGSFDPGWWLQPEQKVPILLLARLAVGPGTKATFCPRPKDNRDKWPGTKACSVVVCQGI